MFCDGMVCHFLCGVKLSPPPFRRKNDHPWQKRWVTFNGSELKYFKHKLDKDNLSRNVVQLEKMIDVKKVPDVSSQLQTIMHVCCLYMYMCMFVTCLYIYMYLTLPCFSDVPAPV